MTKYGIKIWGTEVELSKAEQLFKDEGFGGELDDDNKVNIDEDYSFGDITDVESYAEFLAKAIPDAKFVIRGIIDDDRSAEIQYFEIEQKDGQVISRCTEWEEVDYDTDVLPCYEDDFDWFGSKYDAPKWDYEEIWE